MTEPTPDCKLRVSSRASSESLGIRRSASSSLLIVLNFSLTADWSILSISFRFFASKSVNLFLVLPVKSSYESYWSRLHEKYPSLKLTEKLDRNYVHVCFVKWWTWWHFFIFLWDLTNLWAWCQEKKMVRELPLIRPPSYRRLCVFKKASCVGWLVQSYRVGSEFSPGWNVQINEPQGFPSFIQVEFRNLPRGDLLILTAWCI